MDGFININKPSGITSAEVVRVLKREIRPKKIGYIGTLDPIATGVLPIGLGKATRTFPYLEKGDKSYEATMALGAATDTQDRTGKTIAEGDPSAITEEQVRDALASFEGEIEQIPPMFSAKKIDGKRLYTLAREGKEVERKPIKATISEMTFIAKEANMVRFSVRVTTGAYVRTLCHDMGEKLGCHAHLNDLVRTASGHFSIDSAIDLDAITADTDPGSYLLTLDEGCAALSRAVVVAYAKQRLTTGQGVGVSEIVSFDEVEGAQFIRIVDKEGNLLGIGEAEGMGVAGFPFTMIHPRRVLLGAK